MWASALAEKPISLKICSKYCSCRIYYCYVQRKYKSEYCSLIFIAAVNYELRVSQWVKTS